MARYQIIIAYDGTEFYGFQRQAEEARQRTVQAVVEKALKCLGWQGHSIMAAGRTDTGVHARGQVISFDLDWRHSLDALRSALNANLPPDVAALQADQVRDDFHPRFDARQRRYQYFIYCSRVRNPLLDRYNWRVWPPMDLAKLKQAAAYLAGSHDFSAFGSPPQEDGSTIRQVFEAFWQMMDEHFVFSISANAFLYRMVRRIVGFQVLIGQGKVDPVEMADRLSAGRAKIVQALAPPHGLVLESVSYANSVANGNHNN